MNGLLAHVAVSEGVTTRGGLLALWSGQGTAWSNKADTSPID
jgi:hypothetical protein